MLKHPLWSPCWSIVNSDGNVMLNSWYFWRVAKFNRLLLHVKPKCCGVSPERTNEIKQLSLPPSLPPSKKSVFQWPEIVDFVMTGSCTVCHVRGLPTFISRLRPIGPIRTRRLFLFHKDEILMAEIIIEIQILKYWWLKYCPTDIGPIPSRNWFVFVSWIDRPFQVDFVAQGQNLIFTVVSAHISVCCFSCEFDWSCLCRYLSQQITSPTFWLEFLFSTCKAHFNHFA